MNELKNAEAVQPEIMPRLTAIQWLICDIAAVG
jgi:hypothetical protein